MGVDQGAEPERTGFSAGSLELGIGHRLGTAFPDGPGGEQLDQVGAIGFRLADLGPELVGRAALLRELAQRAQHAGPRDAASVDGLAIALVLRGTHALHRGDAGAHRGQEVLADRGIGLFGGFPVVRGMKPSLRIEVPDEMDVSVDEAGQQRHFGKVDRLSAGG